MDNISLILTVANGLYNPENHIESEQTFIGLLFGFIELPFGYKL